MVCYDFEFQNFWTFLKMKVRYNMFQLLGNVFLLLVWHFTLREDIQILSNGKIQHTLVSMRK